jgi:hypothetical protein
LKRRKQDGGGLKMATEFDRILHQLRVLIRENLSKRKETEKEERASG